jgi:hypothetical protein
MQSDTPENLTGIITEPQEILRELYASKEAGNAIGIWCSEKLGHDLIMCTVESIHDDSLENDKAVIIKELSTNGLILKSHLLHLRKIQQVHQFKTR